MPHRYVHSSFAFFLTLLLSVAALPAQTNILLTNPLADDVLKGNYNPVLYEASTVHRHPDTISAGVQNRVQPDSLLSYLTVLSGFGNRNTGADTVSTTWGIGAARRWAHDKFQDFSAQNENRLLVGYLQFDRNICSMAQHRNVVAVLPGMNPMADGYVLIEAHMDSRCGGLCNGNCLAYGAEDNGSGSALVLELARVMSRYSYDHSIVFMLTIGEEQGLYGAEAMSDYAVQNSIPIKAVLNNDVIGGIYCGQTSSPPSCPGAGEVDSLNVRIFSSGGYNSFNKQLARFSKLEYKEELLPQVQVPMSIQIMSAEDRTGRGGDHIPFRQQGFSAVRFTASNEHGNGSPGQFYHDRQHTSSDSLGVDLDQDGEIDSFFVDFNYLARNARINGNAAGMIGIGPETPDFVATGIGNDKAEIEITSQLQYGVYRVGMRTVSNDWDSVYTISGPIDTIGGLPPQSTVILSVASVDSNGIESLFSYETNINTPVGFEMEMAEKPVQLLQNRPNPFDEQTIITVQVNELPLFDDAYILITDMQGNEVQKTHMTLEARMNEILFNHGFHAAGIYIYSLVIDGKVWEQKRMIMQ